MDSEVAFKLSLFSFDSACGWWALGFRLELRRFWLDFAARRAEIWAGKYKVGFHQGSAFVSGFWIFDVGLCLVAGKAQGKEKKKRKVLKFEFFFFFVFFCLLIVQRFLNSWFLWVCVGFDAESSRKPCMGWKKRLRNFIS